ncbi:MAG: FMN-dependent NADH-azoreductase [Alphaproteobacteria bacterium]|nr:MAG: FMN-dependent NADH-azoreductase [Alphaproteobacteria bacterium]
MTSTNKTTVLRLDASVRRNGSVTRDLTDTFIKGLVAQDANATVVSRDLAAGLPLIDEAWTNANFTPAEDRSEEQKAKLAQSDALIAELKAADVLVVGLPIYNFSIPTGLRSWIDLIARARVTFQYTEQGPKGLLEGKKAYIITASGGTPVGSGYDFATTYFKHVLGFVGIHDVTVIAADQMALNADAALEGARNQIEDAVSGLAEQAKAA